jgi:hypothetical protein
VACAGLASTRMVCARTVGARPASIHKINQATKTFVGFKILSRVAAAFFINVAGVPAVCFERAFWTHQQRASDSSKSAEGISMPIARQPSSCSKIDRMHDGLPLVNRSAIKRLLRSASRPRGIREPEGDSLFTDRRRIRAACVPFPCHRPQYASVDARTPNSKPLRRHSRAKRSSRRAPSDTIRTASKGNPGSPWSYQASFFQEVPSVSVRDRIRRGTSAVPLRLGRQRSRPE